MKRNLNESATLKKLPLWLAAAAVLCLLYVAVAQIGFGYNGFPLDDAWIHQTYARNLGERGEFAFTPGVPSTGSTSPLWTALLSVGYRLRLPFKVWVLGLGILFLGLSGFSIARLGQRLLAQKRWLGPIIGLAVIFEWHLIWAAVSGMETILFIWLSIFLLERYAAVMESPLWKGNRFASIPDKETASRPTGGKVNQPSPQWGELEGGNLGGGIAGSEWLRLFLLGFTGGLLALVRPEGVLLIGLVGLHFLLTKIRAESASVGRLVGQLLALGVGFLLPVAPYLLFNYSVSGLLLPNTAYAKQREYAIVLEQTNLLQRWLQLFGVTLIGFQILLLPGFVKALIDAVRQKKSFLILIVIWWFSFITLYAIRLPVTYQHGRYLMPTIPWLLFLGIWGTANLVKLNHRLLWARVLSRAAVPTIVLATALFLWLGAQGYANDVQFIESEMVKTALWLDENTAADSIIAAHDIGAIGYFTNRPLVDLAGLITPQVIPFIRDEAALLDFAEAQNAEYLVTFPSWYPAISESLAKFEVYSTNSPWAIEANHDNMKVYQIERKDDQDGN